MMMMILLTTLGMINHDDDGDNVRFMLMTLEMIDNDDDDDRVENLKKKKGPALGDGRPLRYGCRCQTPAA